MAGAGSGRSQRQARLPHRWARHRTQRHRLTRAASAADSPVAWVISGQLSSPDWNATPRVCSNHSGRCHNRILAKPTSDLAAKILQRSLKLRTTVELDARFHPAALD
jgi:hypothetical protein